MIKFPFGSSFKNALGIDIGTFSIKIVEMSRKGERTTLENYGEVTTRQIGSAAFRSGFNQGGNSFALSSKEIAQGIQAILLESKMRAKSVTFSLPDFSSFFTSFDLPPMTKEELPKAINFEARQHIPLPLSDVVLDWQVIENKSGSGEQMANKIILVAVPKEVISQYQEIAKVCNLSVSALEAEVFGLIRSLIKENQKAIILVDIGAQSTTINVVENRILRMSHSFDIGGNILTQEIANLQGIDFWLADELKKQQKINSQQKTSSQQSASQALLHHIDLILAEIEKISQNFCQRENKEIKTVILSGSTSLLTGLKDYFVLKLEKEVLIGDPFENIFYPEILTPVLKEIGPSYPIAVGMSLRGLE